MAPSGPTSGATRQERCSRCSAPSGPWRKQLAFASRACINQGVTASSRACTLSPLGSRDPAICRVTASLCITNNTRCAPSNATASLTTARHKPASVPWRLRRRGMCDSRSIGCRLSASCFGLSMCIAFLHLVQSLENAVRPGNGLGTALATIGRSLGGVAARNVGISKAPVSTSTIPGCRCRSADPFESTRTDED